MNNSALMVGLALSMSNLANEPELPLKVNFGARLDADLTNSARKSVKCGYAAKQRKRKQRRKAK